MSVLIILLFILLFAFLAYKRWSPLLLGPFVSVILCLVAGLPVLDTMMGGYMESVTAFISSNFFLFFLGSIFGSIMEQTRAAKSIAVFLGKVTKGRFALPLIMTIAGILCYGGVAGFVVYFAAYPIALYLCKESNISRSLIPAAIGAGCWTFANALPGSPSIVNVLASKNLGTSPTADLVGGIIFGGLVMYALNFVYLEWQSKRLRAKGMGFEMDSVVAEEIQENSDEKIPHPLLAFIPMAVILVLYNVAGLAIEYSLLAGVITAFVFLFPYGGGLEKWLSIFNKGAGNTCTVILNVSLVVGFAGVIKLTTMFNDIVNWIGSVNFPPLVFVAITTMVCSAASASSSGGMGVSMSTFAQTYINMGINLNQVHRIAVIASSTLDTLPHTGGQITLLGICHQSHKQAFSHIFITQAVIPIIAMIGLILWHMILG